MHGLVPIIRASAREYGKIYERVRQARGAAPVQEKVLV